MPPELWIKVIRAATNLPEAFDTTYNDVLAPTGAAPALHSPEMLVMMRASLTTKLAISLVCKTWKIICIEFLYEFVLVSHAIHLPLLVDIFSRPNPGASKWVRRLDFVYAVPDQLTHESEGVSYSDRQLNDAAAQLVCQCPHLRVFSSRISGRYVDSAALDASIRSLTFALIHVAGSLESIEWHTYRRYRHLSLLLRLYERCGQLRYLISPMIPNLPPGFRNLSPIDSVLSIDDLHIAERPLAFPFLHTLVYPYDSVWHFTQDDTLPSLRHIIVTGRHYRNFDEESPSILGRNTQIDTLTIRRGAFQLIERDINVAAFGALHTLIFYLEDLSMTLPSFPHVERIGLKCTKVPGAKLYEYGFNVLLGTEAFGSPFPKLNLIRFVEAPLASDLEKRKLRFEIWERRCRSKGVRLENESGQLMTGYL